MSFGIIPLSPDDKPDGFVLLSMYEKLESENAKLRELIDYALPIAMYAASTEEGDRIRELMREVDV